MTSLARRLTRVRPWWRRFKRNSYRRDRCDLCGHRFRWSRDGRHGRTGEPGKVWHAPCSAYLAWRAKADERLAVLALTLDVTGATPQDVKGAAELRAEDHDGRVTASNRAFRVFHDLEKAAR